MPGLMHALVKWQSKSRAKENDFKTGSSATSSKIIKLIHLLLLLHPASKQTRQCHFYCSPLCQSVLVGVVLYGVMITHIREITEKKKKHLCRSSVHCWTYASPSNSVALNLSLLTSVRSVDINSLNWESLDIYFFQALIN